MGLCFVFSFLIRLHWGDLPLSGSNQVVRSIKVIDSRFITFLNQDCSRFIRGKQSPDDLEIEKNPSICRNRGKEKDNLKCQSSEWERKLGQKIAENLQTQSPSKNKAVVPRIELQNHGSDYLKKQIAADKEMYQMNSLLILSIYNIYVHYITIKWKKL